MRHLFLDDVIHPATGEILACKGDRVTQAHLTSFFEIGIEYVPMVAVIHPEITPLGDAQEWVEKHSPYPTCVPFRSSWGEDYSPNIEENELGDVTEF
jgi:hypothetical protein